MFSFILNTAKYSFHENKQIESSRFKGVSCSVLVVEYGHLAVTKRKASEEWLHAFSIFKPIEKNYKILIFLKEIIMKNLLTVVMLFVFSTALYAQKDVTKFLGIPVYGTKTAMI